MYTVLQFSGSDWILTFSAGSGSVQKILDPVKKVVIDRGTGTSNTHKEEVRLKLTKF